MRVLDQGEPLAETCGQIGDELSAIVEQIADAAS
jgi:hypothetical protein